MFSCAVLVYVILLLLGCLLASMCVRGGQFELGLIFVVISFTVDIAMYYGKRIARKEMGDFDEDTEMPMSILFVFLSAILFCVGFTITANSTYNPVYSCFYRTMMAVLIFPKIISSMWSVTANGDL